MDNSSSIVSILDTARRHLSEGNPILAFQAVVEALKLAGGEEAVFPALKQAQEQYQKDARASAAANELSALFAQFAIEEASQRLGLGTAATQQQITQDGDCAMEISMESTTAAPLPVPILAESGRMQVVVDASSDGSSFVCHQCGGLVSNSRRDEHLAFWCNQASS